VNYLPRLALNRDPPHLYLPSSCDYRREPLAMIVFLIIQHYRKIHPVLASFTYCFRVSFMGYNYSVLSIMLILPVSTHWTVNWARRRSLYCNFP
jgi:hypothetical protein